MLLFAALFLVSIKLAFADLSMMLVWGKLEDISNCTASSSSTFQYCSSQCYNQTNCIVAVMNLSTSSCYLCPFQSINKVLGTTYQENLKTAIKVNMSTATCPNSVSNEGQILTGYNQTSGQTSTSYAVTYTNGTWIFQYYGNQRTSVIMIPPPLVCPSGWETFQRTSGSWCIFVFTNGICGDDSYNSFYYMQSSCQSNNAVLSGIENSDELQYISGVLSNQYTQCNGSGVTFIGAQRTSACTSPNYCADVSTVYQWTDNSTSGTAGFSWCSNADVSSSTLNCSGVAIDVSGVTPTNCLQPIDCYGAITSSSVCGKKPDS